jgi:hypothetical protein
MFTKNIKNTFTADLLNAVSGVLGEAKKKCSEDCECETCAPEEDETNEGYVSHAQRKAVWANRADDGKGHPDKKKNMKEEIGKLGKQLKREHEAKEKKEPNGVKTEETDVPFKGPYRKAGEERKDEYGNKVKNVAKYLAKKAMNAQKNEEVELDEANYRATSEKSKFDSGHRAKLMNPEGGLSYLSQKSYKNSKHARDAAKFYHSVSHLPIQTIQNKMHHYNKAYDAKHNEKVAEEVDIDESYQELMALKNNIARNEKKMKAIPGIHPEKKRLAIQIEKDTKRHKALFNKQRSKNEATNEEVEDLSEISKKKAMTALDKAWKQDLRVSPKKPNMDPFHDRGPGIEDKILTKWPDMLKHIMRKSDVEYGADPDNPPKKKIRKNSSPGIKMMKAANEEVEQIDELSKKTLGSYVKKATNQVFGKGIAGGMALARNNADGEAEGHKLVDKAAKRMMGVQKAAGKLTKEESEQIDEISREALASYTVNAAHDSKKHAVKAALKSQSGEDTSKEYRKLKNREKGIETAVSRLTQEEQDFIDALNADTLDEARGRPKKAGAKDFTINPKTKEKLMHDNPEHMKKIEALQRNGVIPVPKVEANQHIMQQLQRAKLSMRGGETVNFTHGDSQHVAGHHAAKLLTKYAGMKPDEKEAFQKKIGHSHANLKSEL